MAGREVTLCLKFPGPEHALQRLQHSYLESVVEYKAGTDGELQTKLPVDLFSKYQLKGTVTVTDDEIIIQFTPKHSGVHCARIFSDTREICKPVPFLVTQRGETESLPPDRPVLRPPKLSESDQQRRLAAPPFYGLNNPRFPPHSPPSPVPQSVTSDATTAAQTEPYPEAIDGVPEHVREYASDLSLAATQGQRLSFSPQRTSYHAPAPSETRPPSVNVTDAGIHPGYLTSSHFGDLYSSKISGGKVYGTRRGLLSIDYRSVVTADTLRMLSKEADMYMKVFRGGKAKRR